MNDLIFIGFLPIIHYTFVANWTLGQSNWTGYCLGADGTINAVKVEDHVSMSSEHIGMLVVIL